MLRVKNICKEKGIKFKQLAEMMDVQPETVTRILTGKTNPSLSTLVNMANVLNVEVYELFEGYNADKEVQGFLKVGNKIHQINSIIELKTLYDEISSMG
ncbi:MAG: helix-turn-helix domain-containing protein [Prolixibacteraceae bacterium]